MAEGRFVEERGTVVSKYIKKATDAFTAKDGKQVQAQPEKYFVVVVSGSKFDKESGFKSASMVEYEVTREVLASVQYGNIADVVFELKSSQGGGIYAKAVDFKLVEKQDKKSA